MSQHRASIRWKKQTDSFAYERYNRDHVWGFDNGVSIAASASPAFRGTPDRIDPEEAFVAALSSCHMLSFLAICARKRLVIESYEDDAVGFLEPIEGKRLAITRVELRPRITFGGTPPSEAELAGLHEQSHRECFLANAVKCRIEINPA